MKDILTPRYAQYLERSIIIALGKSVKVLKIKRNKMGKKKSEKLEPLEEIKRLVILGLISQGVKAKDIAHVLEVDPSIISRIINKK